MSSHSRDEIRAPHERSLATRGRSEASQLGSRPRTGFHMPPKHPRR